MKNKICMCFIIFAIVMMNISCNNEIESNPISSEKSLNDDVENNSEGDREEDSGDDSEDSEDDFDYTDEGFIKRESIYRNPIDQYFLSKLNSWGESEVEYRQAQRDYHKAWKAEFKNLMKFMKKKCVYDEDKKNLKLLEKSVADQVDIEKEVLKTELIDAYEVNPDSSKVKIVFQECPCRAMEPEIA